METFPLELSETRGRLIARIPAESPGSLSLGPDASLPNGLYFVRAAGVRGRVVRLRGSLNAGPRFLVR
jgi:hypothetical protein